VGREQIVDLSVKELFLMMRQISGFLTGAALGAYESHSSALKAVHLKTGSESTMEAPFVVV